MNRVGIGSPGSGERWATAHGWYHVDSFGLIRGLDVARKNVLCTSWEEQGIQGKSWAVVMGLNKESNF